MKSMFPPREHGALALTLMGMSGVGKSYFSLKLREWGWGHYSCDVEIGKDLLGVDQEMSPDDISRLMKYLGLPGDVAQGGIQIEEFKRRQRIYKNAEIASLMNLREIIIASGKSRFVNDSTGSLCEIGAPSVIDYIGSQSTIIYIEASAEEEAELLARAKAYPKPIYYPPANFDGWMAEYCKLSGVSGPDKMDPVEFSRWVFPILLAARKPKYQAIAAQHGFVIQSAQLRHINSEAEFLKLIGA